MATENSTLELDQEAISVIRDALIIGLDSVGEIQRLTGNAQFMKHCGKELPQEVLPIDTVCTDDAISRFANAFRYLECVTH